MTDKKHGAFADPSAYSQAGLTAAEYAAIHLKVADSGTPWLDEMIEKSRRDELIRELLNADTIVCHPWPSDVDLARINNRSSLCVKIADSILAASKGEK